MVDGMCVILRINGLFGYIGNIFFGGEIIVNVLINNNIVLFLVNLNGMFYFFGDILIVSDIKFV